MFLWKVQLSTGEKRTMAYGIMVIAAGAQSQRIARMVGIGTGEGVMSIPLPVEPRWFFNKQFSINQ